MTIKANSIADLVGNTPVVKLNRIVDENSADVYVKLEYMNPGSSVKDRIALAMIEAAEKEGKLKAGDTIVEPTSGNTGIALAFIAKLLGLNMVLIMPENSTEERVKTMRAFGAEVILTPADVGIEGSRDLAFQLRDEKGYMLLNQFENDDNWKAHYKTTGPEIWKDTNGEVNHFVSAMGTTGTIMGVSTYLKEKNKNITIVGAQPTDDAKIPGIRKWSPEYVPKFFDKSKVDMVIDVSEEDAKATTQRLAKEEGVFAGMSSGGAVFTALKLAETLESGVIVVIICDRGDRYLSSDLFE